jgi:hypothetical protein
MIREWRKIRRLEGDHKRAFAGPDENSGEKITKDIRVRLAHCDEQACDSQAARLPLQIRASSVEAAVSAAKKVA